jgi:hypothetical protein
MNDEAIRKRQEQLDRYAESRRESQRHLQDRRDYYSFFRL